MALPLELTRSILLGSSPSTLAVPGWPKGCDEEGLSALGTLVSGRSEGRGCKANSGEPFPAWAFCRDEGKRGPTHQDNPLSKSLCRELDSAGGHLCRDREGRRPAVPQGWCLSILLSVPQPLAQSSWYRQVNISG